MIHTKTTHIAIAFLVIAASATTIKAAKTMWSATTSDPARSTFNSDPVDELVRRETLAQIPELHQKAAPFQRLQIPEPRELPRLLGLKEQPIDTDRPIAGSGTPPRPVLPVAPVKQ